MKPFSEPEQLKDELLLTTTCLVCGKPLKKQAKGSLTGWIFDNDYRAITERWMCSCRSDAAPVKLQMPADDPSGPSSTSTTRELFATPAAETESVTPPLEALLNTTIADQWLVTAVLASGHMGTVYIGQDVTNQNPVAIKVLRSELSGNSRIAKRFLQECEKAASIAHHNICAVYASGKLPDGCAFVVMDYIEGENLETKIRNEGFLDVDDAIELFIQLTLALEHAHGLGVIHRGLKPTNVLFSSADGTAKLVDFGVAKAIPSIGKETIQLSVIADIFGDPMCMSPEQCRGENVDQRSDVYSLACIMYFALTGKPPFLFANGCQTAMAHLSQLPPPFAEAMFNCDIPASIGAVVMRALEKDPDDRYQTMAQLRSDLEILKRGGTPAIPKPKRAGKKRVLNLPRADVVSTNPRDLIAIPAAAPNTPTGAVAKVNSRVALTPQQRVMKIILALIAVIFTLITFIFIFGCFLLSPHVYTPWQTVPDWRTRPASQSKLLTSRFDDDAKYAHAGLIETELKQADDLFRQSNLPAAELIYKRLENEKNASKDQVAHAFTGLGMIKALDGNAFANKTYALQYFDSAIQWDPNCAPALFGRGKLFQTVGLYNQAKRDLEKAYALNTGKPAYQKAYGDICRLLKDDPQDHPTSEITQYGLENPTGNPWAR